MKKMEVEIVFDAIQKKGIAFGDEFKQEVFYALVPTCTYCEYFEIKNAITCCECDDKFSKFYKKMSKI